MYAFVHYFPTGESLYWSDWETVSISKANKNPGQDLHVLKTLGMDDALMGIRAVDLTVKNTCKSSSTLNRKPLDI